MSSEGILYGFLREQALREDVERKLAVEEGE